MIRDLIYVRWFERLVEPKGMEKWLGAATVAFSVALVGWLVYQTGGTTFVWAHSIYIPILLAAMIFRVRGALITAVTAGLMLGPWMPLDVASGTPQQTINWVYRLVFLSLIGTVAGMMFGALRFQLQRLRKLAFEDIETDLPNRLSLESHARKSLADADRKARIFLLSIRIGNFGEVMTTLGPAVARNVVRDVAGLLVTAVGDSGTVYRMSTDSFAVMLPRSTRSTVHGIADRVLSVIEAPHEHDGVAVHLDAHIGLASFPYHEDSNAEMLIRKSIHALQIAENSGRRWSTYDKNSDKIQQDTLALLGELNPAIKRNELELHYQPKVSLGDGKVSGFEALVRWNHPLRGLVPPGLFIPAAENSALIHPLTDWVLESALSQIHSWRSSGLKTSVAINISGRNLTDDGFLKRVNRTIADMPPEPGELEFELTENSLFADQNSALKQLSEIRSMGIGLSIDDFGTGFSSLSYLQRMPVSALKIDRSFIMGLDGSDNPSSKIVRTSIQLATNLGLQTIAEGVETREVLDELKEMGCNTMQGYYCARPMSGDDATAWFRAHTGGWSPQ